MKLMSDYFVFISGSLASLWLVVPSMTLLMLNPASVFAKQIPAVNFVRHVTNIIGNSVCYDHV